MGNVLSGEWRERLRQEIGSIAAMLHYAEQPTAEARELLLSMWDAEIQDLKEVDEAYEQALIAFDKWEREKFGNDDLASTPVGGGIIFSEGFDLSTSLSDEDRANGWHTSLIHEEPKP